MRIAILCLAFLFAVGCSELVLRNNPGWTREKIDAAFKTQKEQQVNLKNTIPVLIVYGTAVAPEDGTAHFSQDIYGFDKDPEKLIADTYASRK